MWYCKGLYLYSQDFCIYAVLCYYHSDYFIYYVSKDLISCTLFSLILLIVCYALFLDVEEGEFAPVIFVIEFTRPH